MRRDIEKILDSTHDAMIAIDELGNITIFNKSAERLTGVKAEFAHGKFVTKVVDNTRLLYILETGVSELNQRQVLNNIEIITNRMPVISDDGKIIGAIAIFRDVTELLDLALQIANLDETKETLEATIRATQDAISVVDQNGIGIMINPAYTKMTGSSEDDIIGKDCTADLAEGESIHREVLNTKKEVKARRLKVGLYGREVIAEAAPILVNGQLRGSVAIVHDITEMTRIIKDLEDAKNIIRNLEAKFTFEDIKGESEVMKNVIEKAKIASTTPATVLLRGESGTGKELFAHAIHNQSNRKFNQFVKVNCASLNESLLESELFGYEEGAFTGASKGGKIGFFEKANKGTIFLDEIGEMSMSTQVKLLRVIQEREIVRVGGNVTIPIDVRIIAATNVNLEKSINEKKFREDLYYRINVFPIIIPSLRERKSDIPIILPKLINKYNQEYGRGISRVDQEFVDKLARYDWPGNIRELENYVGRAMINVKSNENELSVKHLHSSLANTSINSSMNYEILKGEDIDEKYTLSEKMKILEKRYIFSVLEKNGGNREKTALELGISLRSLYYKIK